MFAITGSSGAGWTLPALSIARDVILCSPVRTAIGTYGGTLKSTPATALGAAVVKATLERARLDPGKITSVVMGNVIQAGNKMNPARQASINGGIPVEVPAMTVNRVCGSGAQAIATAAQEIMLGFGDSAKQVANGTLTGAVQNYDVMISAKAESSLTSNA